MAVKSGEILEAGYSNSYGYYVKYRTYDKYDVLYAHLNSIKVKKGENITVNNKNIITIQEDIPAGHKIALKDFNVDENIIKYGYPIGHTITPISQGSWINEKNIRTNLKGILNYEYTPALTHIDIQNKSLTFKGYRRKNGRQEYVMKFGLYLQ